MKTMKNLLSIFLLVFALAACKTNRNATVQVNYVKAEEPMHVKDKRINEYGKNITENSGASGAGSGSSYSSTSFRQTAILNAKNGVKPQPQEVKVIKRESSRSVVMNRK